MARRAIKKLCAGGGGGKKEVEERQGMEARNSEDG